MVKKAAEPKVRETWISVAAATGYSVQAFKTWRTLPNAPQTPSAALWKRFIADNNLGVAGNRVSDKRESLLADKAAEELAILRLKRAKEERRTVERSEVNKLLLHVATQQKALLYATLEREYPGKVVGRTASEISVLGRQLADRIANILSRDVAQWQTQE